jgi:hypothetical protein
MADVYITIHILQINPFIHLTLFYNVRLLLSTVILDILEAISFAAGCQQQKAHKFLLQKKFCWENTKKQV